MKSKLGWRIFGGVILLIGFFYLFFIDVMPLLGLDIHRAIVMGGLFLVVGSILVLDGKRIVKGITGKAIRKHPAMTIVIFILSFGLLYLWFNSMFELLALDINDFKILLFRISSVGLSLAVLFGVITGKKIFGLKSTRY